MIIGGLCCRRDRSGDGYMLGVSLTPVPSFWLHATGLLFNIDHVRAPKTFLHSGYLYARGTLLETHRFIMLLVLIFGGCSFRNSLIVPSFS